MDFNLPEEIQILRETVRRFVDKELIPLEREYRHDSEGPMPEHLLKPLQEKTKSMGPLDARRAGGVRRRGSRAAAALHHSRGDRARRFPALSQSRAVRPGSSAGTISLQ